MARTARDAALERLRETREELDILKGGAEAGVADWEYRYEVKYPGPGYLATLKVQEKRIEKDWHFPPR